MGLGGELGAGSEASDQAEAEAAASRGGLGRKINYREKRDDNQALDETRDEEDVAERWNGVLDRSAWRR